MDITFMVWALLGAILSGIAFRIVRRSRQHAPSRRVNIVGGLQPAGTAPSPEEAGETSSQDVGRGTTFIRGFAAFIQNFEIPKWFWKALVTIIAIILLLSYKTQLLGLLPEGLEQWFKDQSLWFKTTLLITVPTVTFVVMWGAQYQGEGSKWATRFFVVLSFLVLLLILAFGSNTLDLWKWIQTHNTTMVQRLFESWDEETKKPTAAVSSTSSKTPAQSSKSPTSADGWSNHHFMWARMDAGNTIPVNVWSNEAQTGRIGCAVRFPGGIGSVYVIQYRNYTGLWNDLKSGTSPEMTHFRVKVIQPGVTEITFERKCS